jgi:hypothetical protein
MNEERCGALFSSRPCRQLGLSIDSVYCSLQIISHKEIQMGAQHGSQELCESRTYYRWPDGRNIRRSRHVVAGIIRCIGA